MNLKLFAVIIAYILYYRFGNSNAETVSYLNTEHPVVIWYDTNYAKNFTVICKRISRRDPRHYVNIYAHTTVIMDNHIAVDIYFYQFLTNRYRPSFVEMHFKLCDMIQKDALFGAAGRKVLGNRTCPFPPGIYDLRDMYFPYVPTGFPFVKGRIYCNVSQERNGVKRLIGYGNMDIELKVAKIENTKKKV